MDIVYYHSYLFYKNVLREEDPNAITILAIGAIQSFAFDCILDGFLIKYYCYPLSMWQMLITGLFILLLNYFYFYYSGRYKRILTRKPKIFNNKFVSILLTISFYSLGLFSLIYGSELSHDLYLGCR